MSTTEVLSNSLSLGHLICLILVLMKLFSDRENGGANKVVLEIICGLYAFIWGWQNVGKHHLQTVMMVWTALFITSLLFVIRVGAQMVPG